MRFLEQKPAILQEPGKAAQMDRGREKLSRVLKARDLESGGRVLGKWKKGFH